ncbi:MAG: hypothetical protein LBV22_02440 [Mycoplasmataceae bacterium]|nr:hypothetical protein [Mycoplasmataceae bacterium]
MNISFLEHIKGCIKNIKYKYFKSCPHCHGTGGQTPGDVVTCTTCNGNGVVIEERRTPFGTVRQRVSCPHCRGTGKIIRNRCNVCRGAGKIEEVQSLEVSIPGGIEESPLVVKNHGNEVNGSRGDLYVHLRISKSNLFMREGNDIYTKAYIDPLVAIAGGPIQVPTPYGLRGVVIKPQTANGEKITVPDTGINNEGNKKWFNTGKKGNLIVQILYAKPNRYNNIELERIKELAKKNNEEVEEYIRKAEKEINHG